VVVVVVIVVVVPPLDRGSSTKGVATTLFLQEIFYGGDLVAASRQSFICSRALPQSSSAVFGLGFAKSTIVSVHGGRDSSQLLFSGALATFEAQHASVLSFVLAPKAALHVGWSVHSLQYVGQHTCCSMSSPISRLRIPVLHVGSFPSILICVRSSNVEVDKTTCSAATSGKKEATNFIIIVTNLTKKKTLRVSLSFTLQ